MPIIEIVLFLLVVLVVLSAFVDKLHIPQPILLVLAGLAIGFTPKLPDVILQPDTVFLIFLPPLLFATSIKLSWHEFKAQGRSIISLSTGLVFFTTIAIAAVAHYFIPGFSWQLGFVLGAIISPSDAVAATSVTRGLNLNKRVLTILEGESLLNDASALVAYRYAIAAVVTGGFVLWQASLHFLWLALGGIAVGLLIGLVLSWGHKKIRDNSTLEVSLTLLTPYAAYLLAEHFHLSGVLAVVSAGLFISFRSPETFNFRTRLQANSFWDIIEFLLNGFVFILIGMQLPQIVDDIEKGSLLQAIGYGLLITLVAIVVRILWVFPGAYLPRLLSRPTKFKTLGWRNVAIISWTGMRGVVSLASALAIPLTLSNGQDFPQRELILFITFCVIFCTLVFQGLSLPFIIRLLKIKNDGTRDIVEENRVRKLLAERCLLFIEDKFNDESVNEHVAQRIRSKYETQLKLVETRDGKRSVAAGKAADSIFAAYLQAQRDVLDYERGLLIQMHKDDAADNNILREIEFELDIEESRLNGQMKRIK